jgi:Uma2 family endonuclease
MAHPMMRPSYTIEEYLALEEASEIRHEYVDGEIYAMEGETKRHNRIAANILTRLHAAASGTPCRVYMEGVKLQVGRKIYYPDLMVACGPDNRDPRIEDAPCLVVEVISPSTESTDRREKLAAYKWIETLRVYLIVDQDRRRVERHWRADDGRWWTATYDGAGQVPVPCPGTGLTLDLDAIYDGL